MWNPLGALKMPIYAAIQGGLAPSRASVFATLIIMVFLIYIYIYIYIGADCSSKTENEVSMEGGGITDAGLAGIILAWIIGVPLAVLGVS